jgi:hypothetical protein
MRAAVRSVLFSAIQGVDLDFVRGRYASNSGYRSDFLGLPGATYTRAGAATAETAAGAIINFAANVPRITDRGVLIEEARTNLFPRSDPTAAQMSLAANVALATEPASPPIAGAVWNTFTNTASAAIGYQLITVAASSVYTRSVLCETPDGSQPVLGTSSGTGDFAFVESNIVVPTSTIYTRLSGNTWRVAATFTSGASSNQNTGIIRYTTQNQRVLKFSGFQIELGAFPTSYIPTTGAAATRAVDRPRNTAALNEGTIIVEGTAPASFAGASSPALLSATSTDTFSTYLMPVFAATGAVSTLRKATGGTGSSIVTANTVSVGVPFRFAVSFGTGGSDLCCLNGGAVASSASLATVYANTQLRPGWWDTNPIELNSYVSRVRFLPNRLTNAELQALTA